MKRFWQEARARAHDPSGYVVELDGRPVRLPGGARLVVSTEELARAIAAEWQAAADEFALDDLKLTRLAGTAQDRIAPDPEQVAMALARYAESDLLCYRSDIPSLAARQHEAWQPWLDWAERRYGARLAVTTGIMHVAQDSGALASLAAAVAVLDPAIVAGLGVLVPALGSLVLGLAVVERELAAEAAFRLSILDETFQAERWGEDAEAAARLEDVAADIMAASRFVLLARAGEPP
jgi:chaperone required for assembly of F1-ATPase